MMNKSSLQQFCEVIDRICHTLIARNYQEVLFGDLAYRGIGGDLLAQCPFHGDHERGSFYISGSHARWRCYSGCGSGNWLRFMQRFKDYTFWDALEKLAHDARIEIDKHPLYQTWKQETARAEMWEVALRFCRKQLWDPEGKEILSYLRRRGYTDLQIRTIEFGAFISKQAVVDHLHKAGFSDQEIFCAGGCFNFAPHLIENKIIFPFRDDTGRIQCLRYRLAKELDAGQHRFDRFMPVVDEPGIAPLLFNYHEAKGQTKLIIVEGFFDALVMTQVGIPGVVARGAREIVDSRIKLVVEQGVREVYLAFDNDAIAVELLNKLLDQLSAYPVRTFVVKLPERYKDPDALLSDLGPLGMQLFNEALANAEHGFAWRARSYIKERLNGISLAELPDLKRAAIVKEALSYAERLARDEDRMLFLNELIRGVGTPSAFLETALLSCYNAGIRDALQLEYQRTALSAVRLLEEWRSDEFFQAMEALKEIRERYENLCSEQNAHSVAEPLPGR